MIITLWGYHNVTRFRWTGASVHVAEIDQLQAAFYPVKATPHYGVPQGKDGHGHRGMSGGRTVCPAPGHSAVACRG